MISLQMLMVGNMTDELIVCINYTRNHCISRTYKIPRDEWETIKTKPPYQLEKYITSEYELLERYEDEDEVPTITVSVEVL